MRSAEFVLDVCVGLTLLNALIAVVGFRDGRLARKPRPNVGNGLRSSSAQEQRDLCGGGARASDLETELPRTSSSDGGESEEALLGPLPANSAGFDPFSAIALLRQSWALQLIALSTGFYYCAVSLYHSHTASSGCEGGGRGGGGIGVHKSTGTLLLSYLGARKHALSLEHDGVHLGSVLNHVISQPQEAPSVAPTRTVCPFMFRCGASSRTGRCTLAADSTLARRRRRHSSPSLGSPRSSPKPLACECSASVDFRRARRRGYPFRWARQD